MSAREEILARLGETFAGAGVAAGHDAAPAVAAAPGSRTILELFVDHVADDRATVVRCAPDQVGAEVAAALARGRAHTVLVPVGLEAAWVAPSQRAGMRLRPDVGEDGSTLAPDELDGIDAVVTAARVGIATTGVIVLDHTEDQGGRELTLVADQHVCVVRSDQVVHDVAEAVALLDPARPLTGISGPGATGGAGPARVEAVHRPRTLDVVLVGGAPAL